MWAFQGQIRDTKTTKKVYINICHISHRFRVTTMFVIQLPFTKSAWNDHFRLECKHVVVVVLRSHGATAHERTYIRVYERSTSDFLKKDALFFDNDYRKRDMSERFGGYAKIRWLTTINNGHSEGTLRFESVRVSNTDASCIERATRRNTALLFPDCRLDNQRGQFWRIWTVLSPTRATTTSLRPPFPRRRRRSSWSFLKDPPLPSSSGGRVGSLFPRLQVDLLSCPSLSSQSLGKGWDNFLWSPRKLPKSLSRHASYVLQKTHRIKNRER